MATGQYPNAPPPGQYPPPGPGNNFQAPPPNGMMMQQQGQPGVVIVQRQGGCPRCGVGVMTSQFTICGIVLAILFFPIGILCCLCMKEVRCSNCGSAM